MGETPGGARPKVNLTIDGAEWIVKFGSTFDDPEIGLQEYRYAKCASACGISVPEVRLMPSKRCSGYYAVRRFDRTGDGHRVHMISVSGLLETSHRIPNLDYHTLMQLTTMLTRDYTQLEQLYRMMCFNVYAHNRDDHAKNWSYLYDAGTGMYRLSPAYDLTYSNSIGGEHATTIDGNGRDPGMQELLAVAKRAGLRMSAARRIAGEIQEIVQNDLAEYLA